MSYLDSFDPQGRKPRGVYELLPAGRYNCVVSDITEGQNKSGDGYFVKVETTIIDGEFKDRKFFDHLNVEHSNQTAQDMAQAALTELYLALGFDRPTPAANLINRRVNVNAGVRKNKQTNEPQQSVQNYFAVEPARQAGPAQRPAAAGAPAGPSRQPPPATRQHPKDEVQQRREASDPPDENVPF